MRSSLTKGRGSNSASPGKPAYNTLLKQLNSANDELQMRKEEVLMLRTQLVSLEAFKFKVISVHMAQI